MIRINFGWKFGLDQSELGLIKRVTKRVSDWLGIIRIGSDTDIGMNRKFWLARNEFLFNTFTREGTVFSILHKNLSVKKILTRWLPRLLSEENKRNRVVDSEAILALFRQNPVEFLRRYIIGRNMDTPMHSRDKRTVKTVGFWRRTYRCLFWGLPEILLFVWLNPPIPNIWGIPSAGLVFSK